MQFAAAHMEVEDIKLSEDSQKEKDRCRMISIIGDT